MRWVPVALSMIMATPTTAQTLAHTGELCKTIQTLKKEHHTSHIFYDVVEGKRCFHVHVKHLTRSSANTWDIPMGVSTVKNHPYISEYKVMIDDLHQYYGRR